MCKASPDSVQVTKEAMNFSQYDGLDDTEVAMASARSVKGQAMLTSANCQEGLVSFEEVRRLF